MANDRIKGNPVNASGDSVQKLNIPVHLKENPVIRERKKRSCEEDLLLFYLSLSKMLLPDIRVL